MKLIELDVVVTAVAIGAPVALRDTPLLGGDGREGMLRVPALPTTSTVLLQGAPRNSTGAAPAAGSADWTTIVTLTSASDQLQRIALPAYIRPNVTALAAGAPNVKIYLEGEQ